jgi:hypothetical protein
MTRNCKHSKYPTKSISISLSLLALLYFMPLANSVEIPDTDSNLYILDVSGSTNSTELWKSLKESIKLKLQQPFGNPQAKSFSKKPAIDLSVATISKISANSPIFKIITKNDSKEIWGTVERIFPKSNPAKMEQIISALFGDDGVWTNSAAIFYKDKVIAPNINQCRRSMTSAMERSSWIRNISTQNKNDLATKMCGKLAEISKRYNEADSYFSKPICKVTENCSDVVGAILQATSFASDVLATNKSAKNQPGLCIAVASDMRNQSAGMKRGSILDSEYFALQSKTLLEASTAGSQAAQLAGVKFPSGVKTNLYIIGLGTGPRPIPLDRNSHLLSYWKGFFTSAGISSSSQAQSLDKACS